MDKQLIDGELVPVYETSDGNKIVDARELYQFLEIKRDFPTWFKDRTDRYGFIEGEDFSPVLGKSSGGRPHIEYSLTIDTAKELCMVENNERGSQARKHFIEVEKRFRSQQFHVAELSPNLQMFHALFESQAQLEIRVKAAENRSIAAETTANSLVETVQTIQDTILQRDEDWRKQMNGLLNGAAFRQKSEYRDVRTKSYQLLDERARCDLDTRLRNLRKRLEDAGATKTQIKDTNRMDVIENEKRLKEIYSTIVKELSIGSLVLMKEATF